jgi:hypothetical protein
MTYHDNNPDMNRNMNGGNRTGWVIAGIAALAVAGIMLFAFGGNDNQRTAQTTGDRPAATAPANPGAGSGTTGSGTTSPPANR